MSKPKFKNGDTVGITVGIGGTPTFGTVKACVMRYDVYYYMIEHWNSDYLSWWEESDLTPATKIYGCHQ